MFIRGNYKMTTIYWNGKKEFLICDIHKSKEFHTHVNHNKLKAARMIVIRAYEGVIPDNYPKWMIHSINRLWYGKNTERMDLKKIEINKHKKKKLKYINNK